MSLLSAPLLAVAAESQQTAAGVLDVAAAQFRRTDREPGW